MKTREVERLLSDGNLVLPFDIEPIDIELPELQEDPVTISREKCRLAASYIDGPCIVEDTSLCFSALGRFLLALLALLALFVGGLSFLLCFPFYM